MQPKQFTVIWIKDKIMSNKKIFLMLFLCISILFTGNVFGGEIIVATETESYFYADGKMEHSKGKFKNTYYYDGDKIIRTNVFDREKKNSISDNTVYQVIGALVSDPRHNEGKMLPQVVRAIGFPGSDAVEILSIGTDYLQAVKSTSDYFVITRYKIKRK